MGDDQAGDGARDGPRVGIRARTRGEGASRSSHAASVVADALTQLATSVAPMPETPHERHDEVALLRAENAELQRRVAEVDEALEVLRSEALERRAAVRELAESLPTAMSRRALLVQMGRDVRHHPDKIGVVRRGIAKLGRAPAKLGRLLRDRYRAIRTR